MWIETVDIAIDSGLRLGLTQWRHMKFTGPCNQHKTFIKDILNSGQQICNIVLEYQFNVRNC